jgi:hypothetical protein
MSTRNVETMQGGLGAHCGQCRGVVTIFAKMVRGFVHWVYKQGTSPAASANSSSDAFSDMYVQISMLHFIVGNVAREPNRQGHGGNMGVGSRND